MSATPEQVAHYAQEARYAMGLEAVEVLRNLQLQAAKMASIAGGNQHVWDNYIIPLDDAVLKAGRFLASFDQLGSSAPDNAIAATGPLPPVRPVAGDHAEGEA